MRDFEWNDSLWIVIKNNGTVAGAPCTSWEEARELSNQHEDSRIFGLYNDDPRYDEVEWDDAGDECGFNPYTGCYDYDC